MKIAEIEIDERIRGVLAKEGFSELYPSQAAALPTAISGRNLVAAMPTASGKSLIGYIPAVEMALKKEGKVLYIVPLKALASEKRDDLDKFSPLGINVMMSTGDLDSDDGKLSEADIIVATSEKADSMMRHGSRWIDEVRLVIADEIHLIHDPGRGPTLEVILTKLMRKQKNIQMIALSATISNAEDLARWLNAELVTSDWRPISLKEGVYFNGEICFDDNTSIEVPESKDNIWDMIEQIVKDGGQCMVFVNTRRSAESLAVKYSDKMRALAGRELSEKELVVIEGDTETTSVGRKLSACVKCGTAFHNAGLTYKQRKYVEDNFRNGNIKCITATPTLAAGINLPARRVIVRDTYRFESNAGNVPISVMEIKQMCGRAGRPGYDPYGEAVLVAKNSRDYEHLMEDYVTHDTEKLRSKLSNETILRSHILGLIATGDADSEESIVRFMHDTFFGNTTQMYGIESVVENVADFLEREEMVKREGGSLRILPFGKRISDLYIDPKSAVILRDAVKKIDKDTEDLMILHAAASTPDVLGLYPKKNDFDRLSMLEMEYEEDFLVEPADEDDDLMHESFMSDLKVAVLMYDWINETAEEEITLSMGIGPGDIRSRVDMTDWLLYSMNEVAFIFRPEATKRIRPLLTRVRYGVKEELLNLVSFRGVGRARARVLFDNGIRSRIDVIAADEEFLARLPKIGRALANSLKKQAGGATEKREYYPMNEEEEYMLDKMAEENSGERAGQTDSQKQSRIFDYRDSS
ncbi:MAG: DEAD/DEAH box helicase [Candidatus Methanoplasma sp.]|jgi:helicase|nr:DEAD/DEAH box helicase [Candidatus Methanoplasma sp.]